MGYPKAFVIEVTEEIITSAIANNSGHCMIADAVKASLNGKRPLVDIQTIRWTDVTKGVRYVALTPAYAQKKLLEFDNGDLPEPFTIRLQPIQTVRAGRSGGKPVDRDGRKSRATRKITVQNPQETPGGRQAVRTGGVHVEGGHTPPLGALSNSKGQRRTFGLRAAGKVGVRTNGS